jgi:hypothetical protein
MFDHRLRPVVLLPLLLAFACGELVDSNEKEDPQFTKASMGGAPSPQGPERPLAADLAVEPVSMLVMFNRLQTPDKLQAALNKTPGQFGHVDLDKDNTPDPLTVAKRDLPDRHAFEIRARPSMGEYVVATMVFDRKWTFLGHYSGAMGGAASTYGRPLAATLTTHSPPPAPVSTAAPVAVADVPAVAAPTPYTTTAATAAAPGSVGAVPANIATP